MKNDRKNPKNLFMEFSCMFKQVNLMFSAKHDKALFKITNVFGI